MKILQHLGTRTYIKTTVLEQVPLLGFTQHHRTFMQCDYTALTVSPSPHWLFICCVLFCSGLHTRFKLNTDTFRPQVILFGVWTYLIAFLHKAKHIIHHTLNSFHFCFPVVRHKWVLLKQFDFCFGCKSYPSNFFRLFGNCLWAC